MHTVIIYDSKFGNTERIANAIARGAGAYGPVDVVAADGAARSVAAAADLLLVGGPTQRRGASPGLRALLDTLGRRSLTGVPATAFDTRYRMAMLLSGSAARDAAGRLARSGANVVVSPESFFMQRGGPLERQRLEEGEVERAEAWGRRVAAAAAAEGRAA